MVNGATVVPFQSSNCMQTECAVRIDALTMSVNHFRVDTKPNATAA